MKIITDVLVIGGGLAGLTAALTAKEAGCDVMLAAKGKVGQSGNTIMAQNSIAAVLSYKDDGDTIYSHIKDTLNGGLNLNNERLVEILAKKGEEAIGWLEKKGVPFLKDENNEYYIKRSPGHTFNRVLTVDASKIKAERTSGLAITTPLVRNAQKKGIRFLNDTLIIEVCKNNGRISGAIGFDRKTLQLLEIESSVIILACGGGGQLYPFTTNARDVTGDGYALASTVGAELKDMEFIQFHPTVSISPPKMIIPTTLFAEGAVLKNKYGEEYMFKYSSSGNLATRDVMSRASYVEIQEGRGSESGGVYLDLNSISKEIMMQKYWDLYKILNDKLVIEVSPAAHFVMGGVIIDENACTSVPNLYACGEVAGGVHGANRLSANALTEAVVFGKIAGENAGKKMICNKSIREERKEKFKDNFYESDDNISELISIKNSLKDKMDKNVSVVRKEEGLNNCYFILGELEEKLNNYQPLNRKELIESYQIKLMLKTAKIIVDSAIKRNKSMGAHYIIN